MTGELDPAAPPLDAGALAEAIGTNATLAVIAGAGHGVYRDQPEAFVDAVTNFLGSLPPDAERALAKPPQGA